MNAVFAPDWRDGVPYQRLLAEALEKRGVKVEFLRGYRRVLPLARAMRARRCDVLHLHWPEAYYPRMDDGLDWFRRARFSTDLALATRRCALAVTAHNLHAHDRAHEPFALHNTRSALRRAQVVFAHSEAAKAKLIAAYRLDSQRVCVIAHGDLSVAMPAPLPRAEARARLELGLEKVCLMFGAVERYKGLEEVLAHWRGARPEASLVIAGKPITAEYGDSIRRAAEGIARVTLRLARLSDEDLARWLSAADCVLFNYRTILTSGAASLARSWGVPILIPARLDTVDLHEPSPRVCRFDRFDGDFTIALARALATASSFASAADWRAATSWNGIAQRTAEAYRAALAPA